SQPCPVRRLSRSRARHEDREILEQRSFAPRRREPRGWRSPNSTGREEMVNRGLSRVPAEHLVDLNGNKYPKYAGVLLVAHEDGLSSLTTSICQTPGQGNDFVAIVEATAVMGKGDDAKIFTDCGDASPRNCTSKVATALLRMASTRAKGRALRDAIAI